MDEAADMARGSRASEKKLQVLSGARVCQIFPQKINKIKKSPNASLPKGLSGSSVGGEMEASSQRADIELTLPFGSSSFISCFNRSS